MLNYQIIHCYEKWDDSCWKQNLPHSRKFWPSSVRHQVVNVEVFRSVHPKATILQHGLEVQLRGLPFLQAEQLRASLHFSEFAKAFWPPQPLHQQRQLQKHTKVNFYIMGLLGPVAYRRRIHDKLTITMRKKWYQAIETSLGNFLNIRSAASYCLDSRCDKLFILTGYVRLEFSQDRWNIRLICDISQNFQFQQLDLRGIARPDVKALHVWLEQRLYKH